MLKYPLFFRNLIGRTPADHENILLLKETYTKVKAMAETINARMLEYSQAANVFEVYNKFKGEVQEDGVKSTLQVCQLLTDYRLITTYICLTEVLLICHAL